MGVHPRVQCANIPDVDDIDSTYARLMYCNRPIPLISMGWVPDVGIVNMPCSEQRQYFPPEAERWQ